MERKPRNEHAFANRIMGIALALVIAFAITALIIIATGKNPLVAFQSMITGAFGNKNNIGETLIKAVPLLLAGLGLTVCYRTGMTSIGAQGQIIMGGLLATVAGVYFGSLPRYILIPLALLLAAIAGGLWAGIAGYLKARFGVSEVINTIMLNYVATYFVTYLLDGPMREPPGYYPQSSLLSENAWLTNLVEGTRIHSGVIIAAIAVFVVYFLLWKLPVGYQMRAVGNNAIAARTSGINVRRNMVLAMFLSGAFAGIAGGVELMGIHHRLMNGFSAEIGFDAMAVALLGGLHPAGVSVAALFFAALRTGANTMQRMVQVPSALVNVIQGLVILLVLTEAVLSRFTIKLFTKKKVPAGKEG